MAISIGRSELERLSRGVGCRPTVLAAKGEADFHG